MPRSEPDSGVMPPASPPAPVGSPEERAVLVWDLPTRAFHWLLVLAFAAAYLSGEAERFPLLHVTMGWTVAGLVAFRVLWGWVGTRHARFAQFVRGPGAVGRYLASLATPRPLHYAGHNPAGGWAVLVLLALCAATALSGWASVQPGSAEFLEDVHEALAGSLLAAVGVHVAAVALSSWVHRESLVRAMFTGMKRGAAGDAITGAVTWLGALVVAAVLAFWWAEWRHPEWTGLRVPTHEASGSEGGHSKARKKQDRRQTRTPFTGAAAQPARS